MDMYRILHEWSKREGFYVLEQASPWGLLCLLHLEKGKLVGEVLTPTAFQEHSQRLRARGDYRSDGLFDREVFFEAKFGKGGMLRNGSVCGGEDACSVLSEEMLGQDRLDVVYMANDVFNQGQPLHSTARKSSENNIALMMEGELRGPDDDGSGRDARSNSVNSRWWPLRQLQRIRHRLVDRRLRPPSDLNNLTFFAPGLDELTGQNPLADSMVRLWKAQNRTHNIFGSEIIQSMWDLLHNDDFQRGMSIPMMLNFQYVDGPSQNKDIRMSESMPVIRPGLYCGTYHPEMYGKYCNEILLLEYRKYDVRQSGVWDRIHAEVFNSQESDEALRRTEALAEETGNDEVVFVIGRKVTGDMHVPAGKSTFSALVHPLFPNPNPELPDIRTAQSSDSGEDSMLQVIRQWHGFGTVAYPIFQQPSTKPGILLQLENDSDGNHRFGFLWDREMNETMVLKWLPIQDRYHWFHK
ncbi:hypothetical protein ACHAWF_018771 [Thalassiosira exigua]